MVRRVAVLSLLLALALAPAVPVAAQQPPAGGPAKSEAIVNLNTATLADFESLPGIGAKTAQRILDYRQKSGGFKKVEDLMNVKGIGEKAFLRIKSRLTVAAPKS